MIASVSVDCPILYYVALLCARVCGALVVRVRSECGPSLGISADLEGFGWVSGISADLERFGRISGISGISADFWDFRGFWRISTMSADVQGFRYISWISTDLDDFWRISVRVWSECGPSGGCLTGILTTSVVRVWSECGPSVIRV